MNADGTMTGEVEGEYAMAASSSAKAAKAK
jgi:hypothetical protein